MISVVLRRVVRPLASQVDMVLGQVGQYRTRTVRSVEPSNQQGEVQRAGKPVRAALEHMHRRTHLAFDHMHGRISEIGSDWVTAAKAFTHTTVATYGSQIATGIVGIFLGVGGWKTLVLGEVLATVKTAAPDLSKTIADKIPSTLEETRNCCKLIANRITADEIEEQRQADCYEEGEGISSVKGQYASPALGRFTFDKITVNPEKESLVIIGKSRESIDLAPATQSLSNGFVLVS